MNHRPSVSALAAAGLAALLVTIPVAGQTAATKSPTASAVKSAIPRTADGHPDLSGVYTTATTVPVARPANLGAKEFYSDEADREAARLAPARGGRGGGGGAAI